MDTFYWSVGYIFICLLWVIPASMVIALLINGLLVSLSLTVWEIRTLLKNNKPLPSFLTIIWVTIKRIPIYTLTDDRTTITGKYGTWGYLFKHTVWKVTEVTEVNEEEAS